MKIRIDHVLNAPLLDQCWFFLHVGMYHPFPAFRQPPTESSDMTPALAKKNYIAQIPTGAWGRRKKFMLAINSIKSGVRGACTASPRSMARGALTGCAFEKSNHPSDRPGGESRVDACGFPPLLRD